MGGGTPLSSRHHGATIGGPLCLSSSPLQLDDCWAATNRTADGNLQPDPTRFPSGIPALAEYVHQRGLYLGLYTCAGPVTCKYNRTGR